MNTHSLWRPRRALDANVFTTVLLLVFGLQGLAGGESSNVGNNDWPFAVTAAQRPGTYFWCPGSAFTREDIDWNLEQLRNAGFGFVHVIPIYGAGGAESQYIPYLSPQWMEMFDYLVRRAAAMEMFVDMTTGTGWCFGGPDLPDWAIDARASYDSRLGTVTLVPAMRVKRAAPGGEGPMLNPFSPQTINLYLDRFSTAFETSKAALPRAQYHDSFEYQANWCAEFFEEFKSRCGYDLRDHLTQFFAGETSADPELQKRLKCDYRRVLADLHLAFIRRWVDWAHARGMLTRNQAHGAPGNLLDLYAASDIPETEMFGAPDFDVPGFRRDPAMVRPGDCDERICLLASSAAHVAHPPGKQLVSAETCTWLREHWHTSLAHIKLQVDLFFLSGVNQLLFHGTCYSPKDTPWPGWFFYASIHMDWRNAFWRDVPALTQYIARCQSVLQAGEHDNDMLLYWPIYDLWMDPKGMTIPLTVHRREWMENQRVGEVARLLLNRGFAFDFISDQMIAELKVDNGAISASGGKYRAILVPACTYMPEDTLEHLARLAEAGATVIFERQLPQDVPGWGNLGHRRKKFAEQKARLSQVGTVITSDVTSALVDAGVVREPMVDLGLKFVRRKINGDYWYFVANHTAKPIDGWVPLGVPCAGATLFEAMLAKSGQLKCRHKDGVNEVFIQLEPGTTVFFRAERTPLPDNPKMPYFRQSGEPIVLAGTWQVEFIEGGPALPEAYRTQKLSSWTEIPDTRARAFAGTARYTLEFTAPPVAPDDWLLDLGNVRESARVRLNGFDLGPLIALPFRVRLGAALKEGINRLEVEVTNLSANRIRDLELKKIEWKIMKDANIVNVNYRAFDASQWPVEDSGLLGPVRLIPLARLDFASN
ncbi:MAG: glycosyl hydrolase [Thermogutta sp.]